MAVGVNYAYAKGDSIYGRIPASFNYIGQGFVGPIPFSVVLSLIIWALLYFFLNNTRSGRYIVATGGNPTAARLSGVKISNYRMIGLFLSAVCSAIGGVMLASYLGAGTTDRRRPVYYAVSFRRVPRHDDNQAWASKHVGHLSRCGVHGRA